MRSMQYDVSTPEEYLTALEDDWRRRTLMQIRHLIQTAGPQLREGIEYKMLCYSDTVGSIFHLNAQKNYVSLYVGNIQKIDAEGTLLQGLSLGKGCIRFKAKDEVDGTQIARFIEQAINLRAAGEDIEC